MKYFKKDIATLILSGYVLFNLGIQFYYLCVKLKYLEKPENKKGDNSQTAAILTRKRK